MPASNASSECDCSIPTSEVNVCMYGECHLRPFSELYDGIHQPLCYCICIFGTFSNILNIIVLTRKRMRTPINVLLTGLSIAQWLLAFNYIFLLSVDHFREKCYTFYWSYTTATYRLFNVNLNNVFHTVAFAHTIAVAVFRYAAMRWPMEANRHLYHTGPAFRVMLAFWTIVPILCIPSFLTSKDGLSFQLDKVRIFNCSMQEMYDLRYEDTQFITVFGVVLKLLPSLLLTVLIVALVRTLKRVERRRHAWHHQSDETSASINERSMHRRASRRRTTRMLVAILLLCDAVELPHGVLHLCTGLYGETFGTRIYDQLGSFMEMLTLFYSSVSFILYCTMSADFLRTFETLFCPCVAGIESNGGTVVLRQSIANDTMSTGLYIASRKLANQNAGTCISLSNYGLANDDR